MDIKFSEHFDFKKLMKFVSPSIFMMVFVSIYGVVDGFFVSNFVGKTAFASVNLIMPFPMVLGAVGFMIGTGGTALVSKALGERNEKRANQIFSMMIYLTVICGIFITVIGVLSVEKVAVLLGASDAMINDCVKYGRVLIAFIIPFMLQNVFQSLFAAAGKPKLGLTFTLSAGFANMGLDALFVGVLKMGVVGAAVATGISQIIAGILPLIYFALPNKSLLRLVKAKLELKPILHACSNGSSELMTNISMSLVSMLYNFQLIFISIFIGYSVGSAPIIGYNYGAKNKKELNNMLKKSLIFMAVGGVVLMGLAYLMSGAFAKLFVGYDKELFELTKRVFKIFSVSFLLAGFNIFASAFFTALSNGLVSAMISFLRTLVFQTICVILLPLIFGIDGIWWAMCIAEIFAFFVSAIFVVTNHKKYGYY